MLTSYALLRKFWNDPRYETAKVRIWYTDRGAPGDVSDVCGSDVSLDAYVFEIRTDSGYKQIPYHRILLIQYEGRNEFVNRKIAGSTHLFAEAGPDDVPDPAQER